MSGRTTALRRAIANMRVSLRRAVEDYRMVHVPDRCAPHPGCTCPCGYCHHDRRHE